MLRKVIILRKGEGCMNFSVGDKRYIISDAAKMIEVESHVLRYWEEELEVEVPRNEMGHRYYTNYYIELFKKIKELKESGFQLKAIKMILPELMEINGNSAGTSTYGTLKDELFEKLMKSSDYNVVTKNDNDKETENSGFMSGYIKQAMTEQVVVGKSQASDGENDIDEKGTMSEDNEKGNGKEATDEKSNINSVTGSDGDVRVIRDRSSSEMKEKNVFENIDENHDILMCENESSTVEQDKIDRQRTTGEVIREIPKNNKIEQFQMIIMEVVSNALKENNGSLGKEVSDIVSDNVIKEMDFLMQMKEMQEEERFRKLDQLIRTYQTQNREKSKEKTKSNKGLLAKLKKL